MYWAIDENDRRIYIDDAHKAEKYHCPHCGSPLIVKHGEIIAHHFAHKPKADCDDWYNNHPGKSLWHRDMQNMFPEGTQEVKVVSDQNTSIWHIADVFLHRPGRENVVIEFQHSPISYADFKERTRFYYNNGCNVIDGSKTPNIVIWVFDCFFKELFLRDDETPGMLQGEWPGRDRIKLLGELQLPYHYVFIMLYAFKNNYDIIEKNDDYYGDSVRRVRKPDPDKHRVFADICANGEDFKEFIAIDVREREFVDYVTNLSPWFPDESEDK